MGRCARCGMPMPGDVIGAVCLNCQRQMASQRSEGSGNKTAGGSQAPSQPSYTLSSDEYGNTVKTYANGTQTVYTPQQVKHSFWRTVIILLLLVAAVFVGIKY